MTWKSVNIKIHNFNNGDPDKESHSTLYECSLCKVLIEVKGTLPPTEDHDPVECELRSVVNIMDS